MILSQHPVDSLTHYNKVFYRITTVNAGFDWSKERSAKLIYTSVENDIHLEHCLRIKETGQFFFEDFQFYKLNSS